jgi:hypothetical protein
VAKSPMQEKFGQKHVGYRHAPNSVNVISTLVCVVLVLILCIVILDGMPMYVSATIRGMQYSTVLGNDGITC